MLLERIQIWNEVIDMLSLVIEDIRIKKYMYREWVVNSRV